MDPSSEYAKLEARERDGRPEDESAEYVLEVEEVRRMSADECGSESAATTASMSGTARVSEPMMENGRWGAVQER